MSLVVVFTVALGSAVMAMVLGREMRLRRGLQRLLRLVLGNRR